MAELASSIKRNEWYFEMALSELRANTGEKVGIVCVCLQCSRF